MLQQPNKGTFVRQPLWQRILLLTVLGYEGLGGLAGGILLMVAPDGRLMDMPIQLMHGTFADFLIPGIILLFMGLLNGWAFIAVLRRRSDDWFWAGIAMGGFVIWFLVEIIILRELHWLHLMWGLPVLLGCVVTIPLIALRNDTPSMHRALLSCGILASAWYILINIFVPVFYEGYSTVTFTVSELSAIGSPTRILWVLLCIPYPLLFAAFGWGVIKSAAGSRSLKTAGVLIIAYSIFNFYWPPMQMRGHEMLLTDKLHIAWGVITLLFMTLFIILGAVASGKNFRIYSSITLAVFVVFGFLTSIEGDELAANLPTPMIGVWERINIAAFMIWNMVFALKLMRDSKITYGSTQSIRPVPDKSGHGNFIPKQTLGILILFLICFSSYGQSSDTSRTRHFIELRPGINQVKDVNLHPKISTGILTELSYGFEKRKKAWQQFYFNMAYSRLRTQLEDVSKTINLKTELGYSYSLLLYEKKFNYYLGPDVELSYNGCYFPNWDDSHLYWADYLSLGPRSTFTLPLKNGNLLKESLSFPILSVFSRPKEERLYKIDDTDAEGIIRNLNGNRTFSYFKYLFFFKAETEYRFPVFRSKTQAFTYSFRYLYAKHKEGNPYQQLSHQLGIKLYL